MSIVRVGLAETKNFSEGYDRIFGKKGDEQPKPQEPTADQQQQPTTAQQQGNEAKAAEKK